MVDGVLGVWAASPLPGVLPSVRSVAQQHTSNAPRNCHPLVDSLCSLLNTSQRTGLHTPLRKEQVPPTTLTMCCRGGSRCQGERDQHPYSSGTLDGDSHNNITHHINILNSTDLKSHAGTFATFPWRRMLCWCTTASRPAPHSLGPESP